MKKSVAEVIIDVATDTGKDFRKLPKWQRDAEKFTRKSYELAKKRKREILEKKYFGN